MHWLERELEVFWPRERWQAVRLLVAVSGGADSVALLRAIVNLASAEPSLAGGQIQVAHYNHGWRGAESDGDERFVRKLCQDLQVPLLVGGQQYGRNPHQFVPCQPVSQAGGNLSLHESDGAGSPLLSGTLPERTEAAARQVRYEFLTQAAYQSGARYVLTAHTASDRVETMLHNLLRGTGLAGIVGPPVTRPLDAELIVVRPLLGCWREQIEAYLRDLGQDFRQDASNADLAYQRNYLRHSLLPELRTRFGDKLDERLLAFSELAEEVVTDQRELAAAYRNQASLMLQTAVDSQELAYRPSAERLYLPSFDKLACPWSVVHQALVRGWQQRDWPLQGMSRQHWNKLRSLLSDSAAVQRENLPGNLIAERQGAWLVIGKAEGHN